MNTSGSESVAAGVDLRGGNQGSPIITSPIILQMVRGGLNNVPLGFADVDGDTVTFRMATSAESSIGSIASAGGNTLSVSSNGTLTWDTSSTSVGQLYAVQVIANDNHPLGGGLIGQSRVPFDFIIQIVDGSINHPPVASGNAGPFVAAIGVPFSTVITGTDQDGGNLTVTHQGLPSGATLTPASGTSAPQPLAATFNWTPTLADAGSSVGVTIVFTDPTGLQASKSFAISVPANQPPVANAGPNQGVFDADNNNLSTTVTLDGSASYDPEGVALTYAWTQTGGTAVTLANPASVKPTFPAPSLAIHPNGSPIPLVLTFHLVVSDGKSTRGADVIVTVKHNNLAPTAVASVPATAPELTNVILDGSASSDPDLDPLTYSWVQTAGTPVLINQNANSPTASFTHVISGPHSNPGEMLEFTLTVSDGIASNTGAPVQVFIQNVNQAPTADAGHADPVFDNVGLVTLDGMGTDPDGDSVSLRWQQVSGPAVMLNDANTANPSFSAPPVSEAQGSVTLTFQLIANDSTGAGDTAALDSAPSTVDVLVKHHNRPPVADAGHAQDVPEQTVVTLDGSGSYDPDVDPLTYAWVQTAGPYVGVLDNTDPAHPKFTAPDVGPAGVTLTFQLIVTDSAPAGSGGDLSSQPSTVGINVKYLNRPPTADAGAAQAANEGAVIALNGSGSDPDGNAFTFAWTQTGGPAVALSDVTAAQPSFTAPPVDRFGATLTFALQTKDEFNALSDVATTSVVINNINHAPTADAGLLQSVAEGTPAGLAGAGLDQDTEEQSLLTYAWVQTAGPVVVLTGANTTTPSFTAPLVTAGGNPNASVTLKFQLTVTDPNNASGSAETSVVVKNVDHAPLANAGGIYLVNETAVATLNGSASSDPDGDALAYSWVQVSGPAVVLNDANSPFPYFTAPFVGAAGATLKFQLTVDDGFDGTSTDTATVSLKNINDPPTLVNPRASVACLWPPNHKMVPISILGVVDPDNNSTLRVTSVTQDEATNGLGDGDTAIDAIINADGTVLLRAERSGKGNGRVYHIHFTASDLEGSVSGVVTVCVPHDKKGDIAIDGGELFDSTR